METETVTKKPTREKVIQEFLNLRREILAEPKQQAVADKLGISKAMVSRYIIDAKNEGEIPSLNDDIHVKRGRLQLLLKDLGVPIFIKKQQGAYVSITNFEVDSSGKSIIAI